MRELAKVCGINIRSYWFREVAATERKGPIERSLVCGLEEEKCVLTLL